MRTISLKSRPRTGTAQPARASLREEVRRLRDELAIERQMAAAQELEMAETLRDLEASRERYVELYDGAPVGYLSLDYNGCIAQINLTGARLLGADRSRLRRTPFVTFVVPADRRNFLNHLTRCRKLTGKVTTELTLRSRDGCERTVQLHSAPAGQDDLEKNSFPTVLTDITDRKQARDALRQAQAELEQRVETRTAALRETEQRYRKLIQVLPDAVLVVRNDCVTLANPAAQELLGATRPDQLLDRPVLDRVHPDSQPFVRDLLRKAMPHLLLPQVRNEQMLVGLDGAVRVVQFSGVRFSDQGEPGTLLVLKDVTELKQLEKQLLEISEQEQQRIGQDLHDGLCQHLTALKFKTALLEQKLRRRFRFSPRGFAQLEKRLNCIIEEARTLARGLSPVTLDVNGLGVALHSLAHEVESAGQITCRCQVSSRLQVADPAVATHLYRIAQEAVNNVIKHSCGTRLWLRLSRHNGRLSLSIRDNGVGFSPAQNSRPGLGLHNMEYRARLIRGNLDVRKRAGGGVQITCSLPEPVVSSNLKALHAAKNRKTTRRA